MKFDFSDALISQTRVAVWVGSMCLGMLLLFPFIQPQAAAMINITLVVVATALGHRRWGLLATGYTVFITWLMDTLFWNIGFPLETYVYGGIFNAFISLVFGSVLEAKSRNVVTDGLTGLCNHLHFRQSLSWEVRKAQRYGRELSLLMIDLDHFKRHNDQYGHLAGDAVLRELARILRAACRESDLPCRYGGDEFAVILPETGTDGALEVARRICEAAAGNDWRLDEQELDITVSIGVGLRQADQPPEDLIDSADRALYQAKRQSGNSVATNGLDG